LTKKNQQQRDQNVPKRRRRKLNARLRAITERDQCNIVPHHKVEQRSKSAYIEISELITKQLNVKEAKAASTIKTNSRYFFSYAKRLAKVKSLVSPSEKLL
jgi:hypothetical protein